MDYRKTLTYSDLIEIPELLKNFKIDVNFKLFSLMKNEVFLLGRGSSGNATIFAKYIWEMYCGIISNFIHPYSVFNARKKLNFKDKILFSFSQSGKSPDIVKCSSIIKKYGAKIIAVTNEADLSKNKLARISDFHILLSNSKEIPVAATKSFILQLWLVFKIAKKLGADFSQKNFNLAILNIEKLIKDFDSIYEKENFYEILKNHNMVAFVGRGPFNAIAEDSALKLREIASKHSAGYSAAEFLHGPIGAYGKKDLVFLLSGDRKLTEDLLRVKNKLEERQTPLKIIYPFYNDYPFNALITDIFIKLVAVKFASSIGINPDIPKGLSKVTFTI